MELLERNLYLTDLGKWLGAASAAGGCIALVGGEAGIGKTALLQEFSKQLRKTRVLWDDCARGVRGVPRGRRSSTRSNPHGLTGREAQVFVLLSAGLRIRSSLNACLFHRKRLSTMCRPFSRSSGWHHGRRPSRWRARSRSAGVERDSHPSRRFAKPLRNVVRKWKEREVGLGFFDHPPERRPFRQPVEIGPYVAELGGKRLNGAGKK